MTGSNETYNKCMTIMTINEHSAIPILLHENETQILNKIDYQKKSAQTKSL
jgi:hypothetical protein